MRGLMPHQLLTGEGMLSFGQSLEVLVADLADQSPFRGELTVPRARNVVPLRVVVLAPVLELPGVVLMRLACAEWLREGQHGRC